MTTAILLTFAAAVIVSAFAQTTETDEEAKPSVESQLSLGEDASVDPELGKPYTAEIVGAWEMRCIKTESGNDPCQMYQLLDDGQGAPVAEISLFRLPDGGKAEAGATIVVPLETSLPQQLTISVDGGNARRYPYAFCNQVGCYARLGMTAQDVAAFTRGNEPADLTVERAAAASPLRLDRAALDAAVAIAREIQDAAGSARPTTDGDLTQVEQLLINLIKNAFEAAPDGPVELRVEGRPDGAVARRVLDRGPGFSDEALASGLLLSFDTPPTL